jgi:RimJ/RimL family protein N-acetyltransferase
VSPYELATSRLTLRRWRTGDRLAFARLNADPEVMEFLPSVLNREESDALVERFEDEHSRRGFCPWSVEEQESGAFIGFVGLHEVPDELAFAPAIEIGWRLAREFWGRGYATEAAASSLGFAFEQLNVDEVVSMTSELNERSRRVMERLGMHRDPHDDFEHPKLPEGHRLRAHVLYRLTSKEWEARPAPSADQIVEG